MKCSSVIKGIPSKEEEIVLIVQMTMYALFAEGVKTVKSGIVV